jgi:hypothetical protein
MGLAAVQSASLSYEVLLSLAAAIPAGSGVPAISIWPPLMRSSQRSWPQDEISILCGTQSSSPTRYLLCSIISDVLCWDGSGFPETATLKQRHMQTTPDGPIQQSVGGGVALRIKSLAPTQRKAFFAHLKGAQQVHFANTIAEPDKSKVTSIHPPGAGGVQSKHAVALYRDEASRLQRRLRKLVGRLAVSGTINRADL